MKQRYKVVVAMIVIMVIGLVIIESTKNITFKEVVLNNLNVTEVSSIEIIRSNNAIEDKITVTDPSKIELIMNAFSQLKLRAVSHSSVNFSESYWITIKTSRARQFGMTLYDKDYLNIYDYNSKKTKSYKITNEHDLIFIRGLFS